MQGIMLKIQLQNNNVSHSTELVKTIKTFHDTSSFLLEIPLQWDHHLQKYSINSNIFYPNMLCY